MAWVEQSAAKCAAARDRIAAKMSSAQLADSQELELTIKKVAEMRKQESDAMWVALRSSSEAS